MWNIEKLSSFACPSRSRRVKDGDHGNGGGFKDNITPYIPRALPTAGKFATSLHEGRQNIDLFLDVGG